jgi:hypothetical protein
MFAMGVWLAGTVMVSLVATQNFSTVDRLLSGSTNPVFTSEVARVGRPEARELLRYLSSELNRRYFRLWNGAEVAIGLLVLWLIAPGLSGRRARWGVLAMVGLVGLTNVWLTPEITSVGRSLDFVPRHPPPPVLQRFWMLHGVYVFLEGCKLVIGAIVSVWIARSIPTHQAGRVAA